MNKYGELAKTHWAKTDPARYQAIGDPELFFATLGEQAENEIQELAQRLAGPDQPGEEYLEKVGRLNMARVQAEEAVLGELVWITPPREEESERPASDAATQATREIHTALFSEDDETP
jgi:hypothetical protein